MPGSQLLHTKCYLCKVSNKLQSHTKIEMKNKCIDNMEVKNGRLSFYRKTVGQRIGEGIKLNQIKTNQQKAKVGKEEYKKTGFGS